jgi:hypothetical protein
VRREATKDEKIAEIREQVAGKRMGGLRDKLETKLKKIAISKSFNNVAILTSF